ncbi:MAG: hypothetical protein MOIL_01346 [Candidatus Methanolliviera sp. GoM_oil]|nr:MAG: hypothetical protein MOIL_01346 [Candidatus Methanolliviera sp. GoM_oil]
MVDDIMRKTEAARVDLSSKERKVERRWWLIDGNMLYTFTYLHITHI